MRGLLVGLIAVCGYAASNVCEVSPETFERMARGSATYDDTRLPFQERMAPLRKALLEQPQDVFLHHAFQLPYMTYIGAVERPAVEVLYRKLLADHPDEVVLKYAYARFLTGVRNSDAKRLLDQAIAAAPEFPWSYFVLADLYARAPFEDQAKRETAFEKFFSLCPAPLDAETYRRFDLWPQSVKVKTAAALRARLRQASEPRELAMLPKLWALEFQRPATEHGAVREQVAANVASLRKAAGNDLTLLQAVLEGYGLLGDREGARWARERIAELFPHSKTAATIAIQRWYGDRRRPTQEDTRDRVQGYYRELLEATDEWVRRWPLNEDVWIARFRAVRELPDEPAQKLLEAGDGFMRASGANPGTYGVPPSLTVASALQARGIGVERIPSLIEKNARDTSARLAADANTDWIPQSWKQENHAQADEDYAEARLLMVRAGSVDARRKALGELEAHARRLSGADDGLWRVETKLAAAYIASGNTEGAKGILAKLSRWLAENVPASGAPRSKVSTYASRRAKAEELVAAVAELERRPREAAEAYQRVLVSRPYWDVLEERFAMADKAKALWKRGGGTDAEWLAISGTIRDAATHWDSIERPLPEFALVDLGGRKWSSADLRGKTVLANFWATWCGPCVAELPYIQKLQTALKDRSNVVVLTFNVDENPGVIQPFLDRLGGIRVPVIPAYDFVFERLKVNGFPRTWIVEPDGVVRRQQVGFTARPEEWLRSVTEMLSKER